MEDNMEKRKRFDFFFDFDSIQNMADELFGNMLDDIPREPGKPLVMGFNIRMKGNGRPVIERFGNVKSEQGKPMVSKAREPLVDVIESNKDITITAELPGVEKKDLQFSLPDKEKAVIKVQGERNFYKELELPAEVKPNNAKAKFKNGILEVRLEKEHPSKAEKKKGEVNIE